MIDKFTTNKGELSAYAFLCGYIEKTEIKHIRITLYFESVYHIKVSDDRELGVIKWESFETLTEARKFYKQQIKQYN